MVANATINTISLKWQPPDHQALGLSGYLLEYRRYGQPSLWQPVSDWLMLLLLSCPSHNVLPLPGTRLSPLCAVPQGPSSSQQQPSWAIACGSPQSQLTDCVFSSLSLPAISVRRLFSEHGTWLVCVVGCLRFMSLATVLRVLGDAYAG